MPFDWPRFLTSHRIEWVDKGPSATRGNIAVHCPWCGTADPSTHLAISLEGKGYRCFRVRQHSGRSVPRLIMNLLGCSWTEAQRLAGVAPSTDAVYDDRDLGTRVLDMLNKKDAPVNDAPPLRFPVEFRPLIGYRGGARYFVEYLEQRGYDERDLPTLHAEYQLLYALTGPFKYRLIFPLSMHGRLVNWTGRSIASDARLRYRTLSADPEVAEDNGLPAALQSIEKCLFNYDEVARGGYELLVCEGPFDAMRLDWFGRDTNVRSTCVFTKTISEEQVALLEAVRDKYERLSLVLDNDSQLDLLRVQESLAHLDCKLRRLPKGFKDPAELDHESALEFIGW